MVDFLFRFRSGGGRELEMVAIWVVVASGIGPVGWGERDEGEGNGRKGRPRTLDL